jgi:hypothetical protein
VENLKRKDVGKRTAVITFETEISFDSKLESSLSSQVVEGHKSLHEQFHLIQ